MIATTNKYEEIKSLCPELFRPGRLTPVHFNYITSNVLQQMSRFYFKEDIDGYLPDMIHIPTSQLIELVFEALNQAQPFPYFKEHLFTLLTQV